MNKKLQQIYSYKLSIKRYFSIYWSVKYLIRITSYPIYYLLFLTSFIHFLKVSIYI